jgi:type II secretory pathway pseudopilin PulG
MKKNSAIVLSIIGALAVIAAINPTMQAYAQNDVTATQSNSFTADISQSQTVEDGETDQGGAVSGFDNEYDGDGDGAVSGFDNEYDGDGPSQGFCLQVIQQNGAAGNDATNDATNELRETDCS